MWKRLIISLNIKKNGKIQEKEGEKEKGRRAKRKGGEVIAWCLSSLTHLHLPVLCAPWGRSNLIIGAGRGGRKGSINGPWIIFETSRLSSVVWGRMWFVCDMFIFHVFLGWYNYRVCFCLFVLIHFQGLFLSFCFDMLSRFICICLFSLI